MWRGAFGNLLTGKDPRKPFVDAFADEQLLGFYRYYKIILEHSKANIAGAQPFEALVAYVPQETIGDSGNQVTDMR